MKNNNEQMNNTNPITKSRKWIQAESLRKRTYYGCREV